MRISSEILLKLANDAVQQRVRSERDVMAAFLHGSVLHPQPDLGGAADVDLFIIHIEEPTLKREIVRVTDDVHLDIAHFARRLFRQPKEMRLHPWLGHSINGGKILYDPQHFLDFTQASVRGQFERPDNVLSRAHSLAEPARQLWVDLQDAGLADVGPQAVLHYLKAVELATNALASLSGAPLPVRRLLLDFPARANALGHPGLYAGVLGLLGASQLEAALLHSWLPGWQAAYQALPALVPPSLQPQRLVYYQRGINALLNGERPQAALWPLWYTWTRLIVHVWDTPHAEVWQQAGAQLQLLGAAFGERLTALDAFLDTLDELLAQWGLDHGA